MADIIRSCTYGKFANGLIDEELIYLPPTEFFDRYLNLLSHIHHSLLAAVSKAPCGKGIDHSSQRRILINKKLSIEILVYSIAGIELSQPEGQLE